MAGMEGGVGGPEIDWRIYRRVMFGLAAAGISAIVFGVWMGWW